jgi:hypothetical protein
MDSQEAGMRADGLQRMLDFLDVLREKGIHFWIEQQAPEALMVTFTLVGRRVEVEFFDDHLEFSYFKGNEDVSRDEKLLMALIAENWD